MLPIDYGGDELAMKTIMGKYLLIFIIQKVIYFNSRAKILYIPVYNTYFFYDTKTSVYNLLKNRLLS